MGDPSSGDTFIYDQERGQWVRVRSGEVGGGRAQESGDGQPALFAERIIRVPYQKLKTGNSSYNIVIRPDDLIFVDEPLRGFVYIEGEIPRPGVYSLPRIGRLTLSMQLLLAADLDRAQIRDRRQIIQPIINAHQPCKDWTALRWKVLVRLIRKVQHCVTPFSGGACLQ